MKTIPLRVFYLSCLVLSASSTFAQDHELPRYYFKQIFSLEHELIEAKTKISILRSQSYYSQLSNGEIEMLENQVETIEDQIFAIELTSENNGYMFTQCFDDLDYKYQMKYRECVLAEDYGPICRNFDNYFNYCKF